jgi:hypothetical protein
MSVSFNPWMWETCHLRCIDTCRPAQSRFASEKDSGPIMI